MSNGSTPPAPASTPPAPASTPPASGPVSQPPDSGPPSSQNWVTSDLTGQNDLDLDWHISKLVGVLTPDTPNPSVPAIPPAPLPPSPPTPAQAASPANGAATVSTAPTTPPPGTYPAWLLTVTASASSPLTVNNRVYSDKAKANKRPDRILTRSVSLFDVPLFGITGGATACNRALLVNILEWQKALYNIFLKSWTGAATPAQTDYKAWCGVSAACKAYRAVAAKHSDGSAIDVEYVKSPYIPFKGSPPDGEGNMPGDTLNTLVAQYVWNPCFDLYSRVCAASSVTVPTFVWGRKATDTFVALKGLNDALVAYFANYDPTSASDQMKQDWQVMQYGMVVGKLTMSATDPHVTFEPKRTQRDPKNGFLTFRQELAQALDGAQPVTGVEPMRWAPTSFGGDIMHFDLRASGSGGGPSARQANSWGEFLDEAVINSAEQLSKLFGDGTSFSSDANFPDIVSTAQMLATTAISAGDAAAKASAWDGSSGAWDDNQQTWIACRNCIEPLRAAVSTWTTPEAGSLFDVAVKLQKALAADAKKSTDATTSAVATARTNATASVTAAKAASDAANATLKGLTLKNGQPVVSGS